MTSENRNYICLNEFSNPETDRQYATKKNGMSGIEQCGACSFYGKMNADFGVCCFKKSPFYLETVFEHFACNVAVQESWEIHSFRENWKPISTDPNDLLSFLVECFIQFRSERGFPARGVPELLLKVRKFLANLRESYKKNRYHPWF